MYEPGFRGRTATAHLFTANVYCFEDGSGTMPAQGGVGDCSGLIEKHTPVRTGRFAQKAAVVRTGERGSTYLATPTNMRSSRPRTMLSRHSDRLRARTRSASRSCLFAAIAAASVVHAQEDEPAEEDTSFYRNYGARTYSAFRHEKDVVGFYDEFGEHITDGINVYSLVNAKVGLSYRDTAGDRTDSVLYSTSTAQHKAELYEQFSNLVVTQDHLGRWGMSFLVGDQITTRFTPLTFNKVNYRGIRWDIASRNLDMSWLLSRTRPSATAMHETDVWSQVEYPITEGTFGSEYYNRGIRGDRDMSTKSPYGDYEWLWACHARTELFDRIKLGLTYVNHHVSDIEENEQWFKGTIPQGWLPDEIHFELYDLTPTDTTDAGVHVHDIRMNINGRRVRASPAHESDFRLVLLGDWDLTLRPSMLPLPRPHNGSTPVVVAFALDPEYWVFEDGGSLSSARQIKQVSFEYTVAGNYLVFVSTDRQIPLSIAGKPNDLTGRIEYRLPQKSIRSIYDNSLGADDDGEYDFPNREQEYATTYFGDYIAKSPRPISTSTRAFTQAVRTGEVFTRRLEYNCRTYTYRYDIPVSSVTYGLDFAGELWGVRFDGELAVNCREDMLPGSDESRTTDTRVAGNLRAHRDIGQRLGLNAELYTIAPQWRTSLDNMQPSRFYSNTTYSTTESRTTRSYPDYLKHPVPFDNGWSHIDDNDDNDGYVESDRRRYPSDLDGNNDRCLFYDDGTLRWNNEEIRTLRLPNGFSMAYDDPDGIVDSRRDRNANGTPDYLEDFLLFYSDPPRFFLGSDRNNNGVPDWEDDDILPDLGYSVGAVLTSDGIKTQGMNGIRLNLRYSLKESTVIDIGGTLEGVQDRDLILEDTEGENAIDDSEGRSQIAYALVMHERTVDSGRLTYSVGNELRAISDGIRNDAVRFATTKHTDGIEVDYTYETDPLRYRRAVVDDLVGSVEYRAVPDLEYGLRLKLGVRKFLAHENEMTDDGRFFVTRTYRDPASGDVHYAGQWESYPSRLVGEAHLVARTAYRIGFDLRYSDWRRVFSLLNRLRITPQYKFGISYSREFQGPTTDDPRDLDTYLDWYDDSDPALGDSVLTVEQRYSVDSARTVWQDYSYHNEAQILSVPILRFEYKLFENTMLQAGLQWKRVRDIQSPENSRLTTVMLCQLKAGTMYHGYSIGFLLGAMYRRVRYDINTYDPVLGLGHPHDISDLRFFANLYSGV